MADEIDAALRKNREDAFSGCTARPFTGRYLPTVEPPEPEPPFADLDHVVTTLTLRHDLTRREQSVLRLVLCGNDNGEIGRKLDMAPRTAKSHVEHIWQKLCVHSRAQLMGLLFAPAP